jgi:hypothetical protein
VTPTDSGTRIKPQERANDTISPTEVAQKARVFSRGAGSVPEL